MEINFNIQPYENDFMSFFNNKSIIDLDDIKKFRSEYIYLSGDSKLDHFKSLHKPGVMSLMPTVGDGIDYDNLNYINFVSSDKDYMVLYDLLFSFVNFTPGKDPDVKVSNITGDYYLINGKNYAMLNQNIKYINLCRDEIMIIHPDKYISKYDVSNELIDVGDDIYVDNHDDNIMFIDKNGFLNVITFRGKKFNFPMASNLAVRLGLNTKPIKLIPSFRKILTNPCKVLNTNQIYGFYINGLNKNYLKVNLIYDVIYIPTNRTIYEIVINVNGKYYKWFSLNKPFQNYIIT